MIGAFMRLIPKNHRYGSTRNVFLIGRWAIKWPRFHSWENFLRGLLGNMQEARVNGYCKPFSMQQEGIAKVTFYVPGGFLIIMQRARLMTDAEWAAFDYEKFVSRGEYVLAAEHKHDSWGIINDEVVAIDYGDSG